MDRGPRESDQENDAAIYKALGPDGEMDDLAQWASGLDLDLD